MVFTVMKTTKITATVTRTTRKTKLAMEVEKRKQELGYLARKEKEKTREE